MFETLDYLAKDMDCSFKTVKGFMGQCSMVFHENMHSFQVSLIYKKYQVRMEVCNSGFNHVLYTTKNGKIPQFSIDCSPTFKIQKRMEMPEYERFLAYSEEEIKKLLELCLNIVENNFPCKFKKVEDNYKIGINEGKYEFLFKKDNMEVNLVNNVNGTSDRKFYIRDTKTGKVKGMDLGYHADGQAPENVSVEKIEMLMRVLTKFYNGYELELKVCPTQKEKIELFEKVRGNIEYNIKKADNLSLL